MDIASKLPWKVGVVSAVVAYGVLHYFAVQPNQLSATPQNMGAFVGHEMARVLTSFLQYLIPAALLLGAGISALHDFRGRQLHWQVGQSPSRNTLESMFWREFEILVGETFRQRGFTVRHRGRDGPDGGVDLELNVGQDKYLVQCKQWKSRSVGVVVVRELFGVMTAEGAAGGFVVASGDFTDEAKRFVEGRSIELLGTDALLALVKPAGQGTAKLGPASAQPQCPQCAAPMKLRTARSGSQRGDQFWGCTRYPGCKGTRPA